MFQISAENVGDILLFPSSGKQYKIEAVNEEFIHYTTETGEKYATKERSANAVKLTDPAAIERFEANAALGRHLAGAEASALRKILSGKLTPEERDEAIRVLGVTHQQQRHQAAELYRARKAAMRPTSGLDALIAAAEKKKSPSSHAVPKELNEPSR